MASDKCKCGCGQASPDKARNRKVECESCGYTLRTSRTWLAVGVPTCACGAPMLPACLDDADIAGVLTDHPRYAAMQNALDRNVDYRTDRWSRWWCHSCGAFAKDQSSQCSKCRYTPNPSRGLPFHHFAETPDHLGKRASDPDARRKRAKHRKHSTSRYASRGRKKPVSARAEPETPF